MTAHDPSASMHADIEQILISQTALDERIATLAATITADYAGKDLLLVGLLKGAVVFMVDLARALNRPLDIDFMAISSYGSSTESSGVVRILKDLDESIAGRHVLLVEDIIDTGLTIKYVLEYLGRRGPASLDVCALIDKMKSREKVIEPKYVGFSLPDRFVVGYGLDYAQKYRNLPYIGVLKPSVYASE